MVLIHELLVCPRQLQRREVLTLDILDHGELDQLRGVDLGLDDDGHLFGVVTMADIDRSLRSGKTERTVADVATQSPLVVYPNQNLYEVLQASAEDYGRIPVVDPHDPGHLLGVLRRHDIIKAYRSRVAQKQTDER